MPMFGVTSEILEREGASMSGEEDFFSVARTMPFVAGEGVSTETRMVEHALYLLCLTR